MIESEVPVCNDCWERKAPWAWIRGFRDRMEIDGRMSCGLCGDPADQIVFLELRPFGSHPWYRPTMQDRVNRRGATCLASS